MQFLLVNLHATFFRLFEWGRVVLTYYRKLPFLLNDLCLAAHYVVRNPHQVSKAFMKERGEKNVYTYGETPLTTLDKIARRCRILSHDVVYELGCGSGRTIFWLSHFVKCRAIGVDYQPTFIRRAERVKNWLGIGRAQFILGDMLAQDYRQATVLYLYGTCLDDATIHKLIERLNVLKKGTRVISVSYPLTDYSSSYRVIDTFSARFPWGKAEVYLNCKVDAPHRDTSGAIGGGTAPSLSTDL